MNELYAILPLIAVMLASGFVSGIMAGLLGIGGGIVVVPILENLVSFQLNVQLKRNRIFITVRWLYRFWKKKIALLLELNIFSYKKDK